MDQDFVNNNDLTKLYYSVATSSSYLVQLTQQTSVIFPGNFNPKFPDFS